MKKTLLLRFFIQNEKHDHHFTYYVQNQIAEYLRSISCDVDVMTDVRVSIKVVTVSVIYRTRFKNLATEK
jgi:hypothetical protein